MNDSKEKLIQKLDIINEQINFVRNIKKDKSGLHLYSCEDVYKKFNKWLRDNTLSDQQKDNEKILNCITDLFELIPPLKNPLIVYRGKKSDKFRQPNNSFISTSLVLSGTDNFHNRTDCCILEILVPAGAKILPIFEYGIPSEYEILLDREGTFQITQHSIEDIQYSDKVYKNMKIIKMIYIPNNSVHLETLEYKGSKELDDELIKERIVDYLKSLDSDFFDIETDFNFEVDNFCKNNNIVIDDNLKNKIYKLIKLF